MEPVFDWSKPYEWTKDADKLKKQRTTNYKFFEKKLVTPLKSLAIILLLCILIWLTIYNNSGEIILNE